jgi:hypothetical protein
MIRIVVLALLIGFTHRHPEVGVALLLAFAVGAGFGYHAAIRKTGVGMVRAGARRIATGRL